VDVQASGFLLAVYAWGAAGERWVVDWRAIPGDPKSEETHASLLEALLRHYQHASGLSLPILAICIDSGFASDEVYSFVLKHQARRIYATKGDAGQSGQPLVWKISPPMHGQTTRTRAAASRGRRLIRPVALYHVNADDGKALVMSSLALAAPGPNYTHFPARVESVDSEFFAQLCAEHRETRYNKANVATHSVWIQDREANHALDATVLALVAFRILRPNLADMARRIAEASPASTPAIPVTVGGGNTPPAGGQVPLPLPATPKPPARRIWRSSYLSR
jgi:phage terminase large subunit GpA-like protein